MDITPLISNKNSVLQSYDAEGFKVSGQYYEGTVLVTPTDAQKWVGKDFSHLDINDFDALPADIKLVLIGTGKTMQHLPADLKIALKERGIGIETMDTGAACRTFNVLMSDGRNLATILYPLW